MKVKELIEQLQQLPQDMEVLVRDVDGWTQPIDRAEEDTYELETVNDIEYVPYVNINVDWR